MDEDPRDGKDNDGDGLIDEDGAGVDGVVSVIEQKRIQKGIDTDGDGVPDSEDPDIDNDGIPNMYDYDDDNDGIPDTEEEKNKERSSVFEAVIRKIIRNPVVVGGSVAAGLLIIAGIIGMLLARRKMTRKIVAASPGEVPSQINTNTQPQSFSQAAYYGYQENQGYR